MATRTNSSSIQDQRPAKRARRLTPDERRRQLLACAVQSFARHGLALANHAHVAAIAGVSVPTVFFYFKTREALVDAVLSELEGFYLANYVVPEVQGRTAVEALSEAAQRMTGTIHSHPDYARIWLEWSVAIRSELWPRYLRLYRRMNRMWAKVIERGQREGSIRPDLDPLEEAAILTSTGTALIQAMEAGASPARLDHFQRTLIQSLRQPREAHDLSRNRDNQRQLHFESSRFLYERRARVRAWDAHSTERSR